MLDSLGTKIDAVHEQVSNMNEKLKSTIEKVFFSTSSIFLCMYLHIMCVKYVCMHACVNMYI